MLPESDVSENEALTAVGTFCRRNGFYENKIHCVFDFIRITEGEAALQSENKAGKGERYVLCRY